MTRILYFTSPMCRPCRSFGPLLLSELEALGHKAEKIDVSTDEGRTAAIFRDVVAVPTVVIERDGEEVSRFGALLGDSLTDALSVLR
ncbi:thioredoxin family protein [Actinacidiphila glaucinigra]|uniref:thioredoxin family protein n=1 Tax=Actinacidiphila glaucinigra TaxID=235986 RepID=UPI0036C90154